MGDCEVQYDNEEKSDKPIGAFRVSNSNQIKQIVNKFIELEHTLINTKLENAQAMSQVTILA